MKFNWKGLILAPLLVPFISSAVLLILTESSSPLYGMLLFFAIGSVFSYCATLLLFLPCLYLLSKFTALTLRLTSALGAVLGAVAYIVYARQAYQASGIDSGPPQGSFAEYLWRDLSGPLNWIWFPLGGLITALAYWMLVNRPPPANRTGAAP